MSSQSKDANYFKILDAVVRLEVSKGHLRWKIAELSRLSGVQRTLIYYYFGKSKEVILNEALRMIGDDFFGLSPERMRMWQEGQVKESILATRKLLQAAPHVAEFYFHWRHQASDVQSGLQVLEKRYQKKLREQFPTMSAAQIEAVFALFFGMVLVADLKESTVDHVLQAMKLPR